jgi:hypothetical protein
MRRLLTYLALFVAVTLVAGTSFWLRSDEADWWAYVDLPQGRLPKFRFTWPEQLVKLVISGIIGLLVAAPVTIAVFAVEAIWLRRTRAKLSTIRDQITNPLHYKWKGVFSYRSPAPGLLRTFLQTIYGLQASY